MFSGRGHKLYLSEGQNSSEQPLLGLEKKICCLTENKWWGLLIAMRKLTFHTRGFFSNMLIQFVENLKSFGGRN